ncbi:hypothetical protein SAMN05216474_2797 [Lishizhenia tianjinensis]|uniref:Uncharacterized protein n=1 Tax=Lishizhenia tianjinensis TaxID=477690 RepID=A0A1I7BG08_9FLAO|nr:hypothetical protein [Lishizhenia tianjinensis]SFT86051.1 hypothetical protein SAMN05216474_2797 [Lishizhenia tianjinensis]
MIQKQNKQPIEEALKEFGFEKMFIDHYRRTVSYQDENFRLELFNFRGADELRIAYNAAPNEMFNYQLLIKFFIDNLYDVEECCDLAHDLKTTFPLIKKLLLTSDKIDLSKNYEEKLKTHSGEIMKSLGFEGED